MPIYKDLVTLCCKQYELEIQQKEGEEYLEQHGEGCACTCQERSCSDCGGYRSATAPGALLGGHGKCASSCAGGIWFPLGVG